MAEEKREILVCPNKACIPSIIAAPKPLHIAPKIQATHEFLAHIIISKLLDRQPLYHLAKKLQTRHGVARIMMSYYRKLYAIERQAKENKLSFEQRYQLRLEKSKSLLDKMKTHLDEVYPGCMPNSELYKAVRYTLTHWTKLKAFLLDGRLEIDNNLTEQEIKYLVMARKNFLFADTVAGAHALCLHLSIIRTAIINGLDPYQYLLELFNRLQTLRAMDRQSRGA